MRFKDRGQRIIALKHFLYAVGKIYGIASARENGIRAVCFLNGYGEDDLNASDLSSNETIDRVVDAHEFEGRNRLATGLMRKILVPLVFGPKQQEKSVATGTRALDKLERPLLVMAITDGVGWVLDDFFKEKQKKQSKLAGQDLRLK